MFYDDVARRIIRGYAMLYLSLGDGSSPTASVHVAF